MSFQVNFGGDSSDDSDDEKQQQNSGEANPKPSSEPDPSGNNELLDPAHVKQLLDDEDNKRALDTIVNGHPYLENVVLLVGETGVGKSTTINYLQKLPLEATQHRNRQVISVSQEALNELSLAAPRNAANAVSAPAHTNGDNVSNFDSGSDSEPGVEGPGPGGVVPPGGLVASPSSESVSSVANSVKKYCEIGHRQISKTLIPSACNIPDAKLTIIDTAGFSDNRSLSHELVASVTLSDTIQSIPTKLCSVCFVVEYHSIFVERAKILDTLRFQIEQLFAVNITTHNPRVFFLVTKIPNNMTAEVVTGRLLELKADLEVDNSMIASRRKNRIRLLKMFVRNLVLIKPLETGVVDDIVQLLIGPDKGDKPGNYIETSWIRQVMTETLVQASRAMWTNLLAEPTRALDVLDNAFARHEQLVQQATAVQQQLAAYQGHLLQLEESDGAFVALRSELKTLRVHRMGLTGRIEDMEYSIKHARKVVSGIEDLIVAYDSSELVPIWHDKVKKFEKIVITDYRFIYNGLEFDEVKIEYSNGGLYDQEVDKPGGKFRLRFSPKWREEAWCKVELLTQKRKLPDSVATIRSLRTRLEIAKRNLVEFQEAHSALMIELDTLDEDLRNKAEEATKATASLPQLKHQYQQKIGEFQGHQHRLSAQVASVKSSVVETAVSFSHMIQPCFDVSPLFLRSTLVRDNVSMFMQIVGRFIVWSHGNASQFNDQRVETGARNIMSTYASFAPLWAQISGERIVQLHGLRSADAGGDNYAGEPGTNAPNAPDMDLFLSAGEPGADGISPQLSPGHGLNVLHARNNSGQKSLSPANAARLSGSNLAANPNNMSDLLAASERGLYNSDAKVSGADEKLHDNENDDLPPPPPGTPPRMNEFYGRNRVDVGLSRNSHNNNNMGMGYPYSGRYGNGNGNGSQFRSYQQHYRYAMGVSSAARRERKFVEAPSSLTTIHMDNKAVESICIDRQAHIEKYDDPRSGRSGYIVTGSGSRLKKAANDLSALLDDIERKLIKTELDMGPFAAIIYSQPQALMDLGDQTRTEVSLQSTGISEHLSARVGDSEFKISVMMGSILDVHVDAIVNAANSQLRHGGGIARVIAKAASRSMELECQSLLRKRKGGQLFPGSALVTKGHRLRNARFIIHTVSPSVHGQFSPAQQSTFRDCIYAALDCADGVGAKSIAFPGVGTGIFGVPRPQAASLIVQTIRSYIATKPETSLQRVVLLDINPQVVFEFVRSVRQSTFALGNVVNEDDAAASSVTLPGISSADMVEQIHYQWLWQEDLSRLRPGERPDGFIKYDYNENVKIEAAYKQWKSDGQQSVSLEIFGDRDRVQNGSKYRINFGEMYQENTKTSYKRKILREEEHVPTIEDAKISVAGAIASAAISVFDRLTGGASSQRQNQPKKKSDRLDVDEADLEPLTIVKDDAKASGSGVFVFRGMSNDIMEAKRQMEARVKRETTSMSQTFPAEMIDSTYVQQQGAAHKCSITVTPLAGTNSTTVTAEGLSDSVHRVMTTITEYVLKVTYAAHEEAKDKARHAVALPDEWEPMTDQNAPVQMFDVPLTSGEGKKIVERFLTTLSGASIKRIRRVQHPLLWERYAVSRRALHKKLGRTADIEKLLYHGTRNTPPDVIYQTEDGFDMRYSAEGMWGQGIYFAVNSSYSDGYAHKLSNGNKSMFLARVLVGDDHNCSSTAVTKKFRKPPAKAQTVRGYKTTFYDSVSGTTNGSKVYIVYENSRACPAYFIEYQ
jgi:O-acetyl-ADP-ribose deacetylase (regulator of RNase III)